MKIEIEKSEYDRLKSREEKLMAYYEWFVDKENDLVTVEDIVNKIKELEEENKKLREENEMLRCSKGGTPEKVGHEEFIQYLMEENKKQKEENELLKQCLDKLMFDADVVNVKIHGELGDYVYVRSDKQFKLNVKD